MGTFFHPITLIGPSGERETLDALVDTGSTFTSIPRDVLAKLGVEPRREVRLRLADGRSHLRQLGRVLVQLDGVEELTFVIFGEPDSPPAIGAVTLEVSQLGVDPSAKRLVPVEGWQAGHA
ncbi:MAG: aspartyl protease family protein [Dehalococcoidia bacterium]